MSVVGGRVFDFQIVFVGVVLKAFPVAGPVPKQTVDNKWAVRGGFNTHSKYSVRKCRLQTDQVHGCELWSNILDMT